MGPAYSVVGPSFEPLQSVDLRPLTLKTALLLALASVKHMGDLQVQSVRPSCIGPNDSKIMLKPRHGYIPKVLSTSVQSAGDYSLSTSSFGARPGVDSTLPCQAIDN